MYTLALIYSSTHV